MKGNIIDLAVAVVIGAAFGKIVTALTESFIMPIISLILGKGGVSDLKFVVRTTVFPVGLFLQSLIDFILIAFVLFLIVKMMNRMTRKKQAEVGAVAPPELSTTEKLLVEIRDSLRK